jgi:regulator of protease activity HflC (stomatin/prohibitin superfamily)
MADPNDAPGGAQPDGSSESAPTGGQAPGSTMAPRPQLTSRRVPLVADFGAELATVDSLGRLPVLLEVRRGAAIKLELVLIAVALVAGGVVLPLGILIGAIAVVAAIVVAVIGLWRAVFIRIPPGARGMVSRSGRFAETVEPGMHFLRPGKILTHVITAREIPFDAPIARAPTVDGVRIDVDMVVTFRIVKPDLFVFAISPADFDSVLQGACQEAVRTFLRTIDSEAALDIVGHETLGLSDRLNASLGTYGAEAASILITWVAPPLAFIQSREARRLAELRVQQYTAEARLVADRQAAEQSLALAELNAVHERRKAKLALRLAEVEARLSIVEAHAKSEELRLRRLDERILAHPAAAKYDVETARLEVTRALAANGRAVVRLGESSDLVETMSVSEETSAPVISNN